MQVRHGFAAIRAVVYDEPIAVLAQTELRRHSRGLEQQMTQQAMVLRGCFRDAGDRFLWNDKHVNRCLRFDVTESQHQVVFVNDVGRNFACDDFLKESLAHNRECNGSESTADHRTMSEQLFAPGSLLRQRRR